MPIAATHRPASAEIAMSTILPELPTYCAKVIPKRSSMKILRKYHSIDAIRAMKRIKMLTKITRRRKRKRVKRQKRLIDLREKL